MPNQHETPKSIFLSALEVQMGPERDAFIERECGGNELLLREVKKLLEHQAQADSFLESPVAAIDLQATDECPGVDYLDRKIGHYKIRELIGEGGMGVVYVAQQEKPIRRKVALKVIKPGMDSKAVLGRFEAERNALALMNHPNIAKVLDAGTTDEGTPYFVMELVHGNPITQYCDGEKLTIRERLGLFVDVCSAIQHAHQKGIIHRDIKPSNVLVTELDGKSIVKVIDFGVAKALNQSLTDHSIYTAFQTVIGTPLYMSPEQASFSAVDVDTRSDVYSLGVLLYELLTGTTPFTSDELKRAAQDEVLRLIREQEPPRPSNRISSLGDSATTVSQRRQSQPDQLGRTVKGDLDWIVMKSLSKERGRRYDSANRFADDVQRYLNNDLVEARPPSMCYQLTKLYYRNRSLVSTVAAFIVALSIALGGVSWGYFSQRALVAERDQVVAELRKSRLAEILELVFSGESEDARKELEAILGTYDKVAGDRELRFIRALVKTFGTDSERLEANSELVKLDKEFSDLATKSLLVASYQEIGDEWKYFTSVAPLRAFNPSTFEEHLLRGHAYLVGFPEWAAEDLEAAVRIKPSSGVARALLSRALHGASLKADYSDSVQFNLARSAIEQADIAEVISKPDNVLVKVARIDAYAGQLHIQSLHDIRVNDPRFIDCANTIRRDVEESFLLPYHWQIHRAQIDALRRLECNNQDIGAAARQRILTLPESEIIAPEPIVKLIQIHYREGNLPTCSELATRYERLMNGFAMMAFLPKIEWAYENGASLESIQGFVEDLVERNTKDVRMGGPQIATLRRLVDQDQLAAEAAKPFLEFLEFHEVYPVAEQIIPTVERLAGRSTKSNAEVLADVETEAYVGAAFWLGVDELARGNRQEAKRLFESVATKAHFRQFNHEWARIFAEQLEDPNWLPWLVTEETPRE